MNARAHRVRFLVVLLVAGAGAFVLASAARPSSDALEAPSGVIAYTHIPRRGSYIYAARMTDADDTHPLTRLAVQGDIASYSPDGTQIVFGCRGWNLCTMNADGRHERRITFTKNLLADENAWSPNAKEIAFTDFNGGIWVMHSNGTDRRLVVPSQDCECDSVSWSPDGKQIAFAASPNSGPEQIYVVNASGGSPTQLTHQTGSGTGAGRAAWSPNGRKILFSSDRGNSPRDQNSGNDYTDLWMMNADGSDLQRVTNTPNLGEDDPAWSPDGRWIAYSVTCPQNNNSAQIYVARPNGSHAHPLTHPCSNKDSSQNYFPAWQPTP